MKLFTTNFITKFLIIFIVFSVLITTSITAQSFEKQLIKSCQPLNFQALESKLSTLKNDSVTEYTYNKLIDYGIINDFQAHLFEVKRVIKNKTDKNNYATYRIKIIEKNNKIAFFEIERGYKQNNDLWKQQQLIMTNCGTTLFSDLMSDYTAIYAIRMETALIFSTDFVYFMIEKHRPYYFNCPFYNKRTILTKSIDNQDTTQLLNWLKSGNVPLQLYAIEGIFTLNKKGISFPKNTWNLIELVQQKEGTVQLTKACTSEQYSIYTLVHNIKSEHRKAKRKIKKNRLK